MKPILSLIGLNLILTIATIGCFKSYGQSLDCKELGEQIAADTTKSIWDYHEIAPTDYFCLGQYFAKRDIGNKIWLIQSYGGPFDINPCIQCQFKENGYGFIFHGDIIDQKTSNFIEGYNSISKDFLKQVVGDSIYTLLDKEPSGAFNPRKILRKNFIEADFMSLLQVTKINDTTVNVKLNVDSIFYDYPQFKTKIKYHIYDRYYKKTREEHHLILDYHQMTTSGFNLFALSNGKFWYSLNFDFALLEEEKEYCGCGITDWTDFGYMFPADIPEQYIMFVVIKKDMHGSVLPFYISDTENKINEINGSNFIDTLIGKFGMPIIANMDYDLLIEGSDSLNFVGSDIERMNTMFNRILTEKNLKEYCEKNGGLYVGGKFEYLIFKANADLMTGSLRIRYWTYLPIIRQAMLAKRIQFSSRGFSNNEIDYFNSLLLGK